MKKIKALVIIDREAHVPTENLTPELKWVLNGDVKATRKRDGQPVKFTGGEVGDVNNWLTRRAVKPGKKEPEGFVLEEEDKNTGKKFGWEPVTQSAIIKAFKQALQNAGDDFAPTIGQTFETCGPKVQGNPEKLNEHELFAHGEEILDFEGFNEDNFFAKMKELALEWKKQDIEGIVFWHNDAPVAKLRVKDIIL